MNLKVVAVLLAFLFLALINVFAFGANLILTIPAGMEKDKLFYQKMEGHYLKPQGVAFDGKYFYIGDIHKSRIFICDRQGKYVGEIKNDQFSQIEALHFGKGYLWVELFNNYFETMSLWKIDRKGRVVLKIDPFNGRAKKRIVEYKFKDGYIWAIAEDNSCFKIEPKNGKIEGIVPSGWFDKTGYYRLVEKKGKYYLYIWDKERKFRKKVLLSPKKYYRLVEAKGLILVDSFDYANPDAKLYHYNLEGKIDGAYSRTQTLIAGMDGIYMLRYSFPKAQYVNIVKMTK